MTNRSSTGTMTIYWFKAQAPRRVLALTKHLGIPVETIELDLMGGGLETPEYAQLNPNKKAPTLVDGDMVLWESSAIMAYLCIKAGSDMWPAHNPAEQVEVLRWLSWNDCHWLHETGAFYFEHIIKQAFGLGAPDRALLVTKEPRLIKLAQILNSHLSTRQFVACNRLTIADFQLASMATYWREAEMPFADFPHIVRWIDGLLTLPAWAEPWPS